MALQTLFGSPTDTVNYENAPAYSLAPKQALAQYAATGCFGRTFYATEQEQLERVLRLCAGLSPEYVAQVAVYSRTQAYMKDLPALLCAWLSTKDARLHEFVFARVIDNTRMLRTYVQILRSGVVGRKSLGTAPRRLVRQWLEARDPEALFASHAGQKPSLADVIKMVHPKPENAVREAFYGYLLGREFDGAALPELVKQFESFRSGTSAAVPALPFTLLSALPLRAEDWREIARHASWQTTRMNLNTFARHGVFEEAEMVGLIAARLRDASEVRRARVFPYQLLAAFQSSGATVPAEIRDALQDAMEVAIANVPAVQGKVVVCPDVSGSMNSPVTGFRPGASAVRCVDVAALVAAALVRKNPSAMVLPFENHVVRVDLNASDSVMSNAGKLAAICGGGTNCSAPLALLNERQEKADLVVFVSDNQSWSDPRQLPGTALGAAWDRFRQRNPEGRLVCLDIQLLGTTQVRERADILNIGGFSDQVFEVIAAFASGQLEADHWVGRIEAIAA